MPKISWGIWRSHVCVTYEWGMPHTYGSGMSRVNESCHVTHMSRHYLRSSNTQKVMSHIKKSNHIWRTHVAYSWDMSHMNESCHMWMSHVTWLIWAGTTCGAAMPKKSSPHTWICRRKSLAGNVGSGEGYLSPLYFRRKLNMANRDVFTPQSEMCHITYVNESCHTCEWVISRVWMSHVTHMKESWHTYEWVMSHKWMSHGTHMNESWHTYEWIMAHIWMSHITRMNESWHTYEWVMSHIWMSHVTHTNESWHTYEWVISRVCMSHATHMNESCHTYEWVLSHIRMSHATHMNELYHT